MLARIHRVELYNFKSYAGHVTIGPLRDFTCIVGPNGSGKSNLMDALCFVLSSNTAATLRGRDAADFIHRGAQPRECSVTAVLRHNAAAQGVHSNSTEGGDHGTKNNIVETSFTRAVDHSGHLTHTINGAAVNEKQFFAAMEKFKVGARANNFLVFQHEVEAVAQKKARELTELLEQISGSGELKEEYARCKKALDAANNEVTSASVAKRGAVAAVNQMRIHKKEAEKYDEVLKRITEEKRNESLVHLLYVENNLEKQKKELNGFVEKLNKLKSITSEENMRKMKGEYVEMHKTYLEELKKVRKEADALRGKHSTLERIKVSLTHLNRKREVQQHELDALIKKQKVQSKEAQRIEEQLQPQKALLVAFDERCKEEDKTHTTLSGVLSPEELSEYRNLRKDAECETVVLRQQLQRVKREEQSLIEGQKQCAITLENVKLQKEELTQDIERNNNRVTELKYRIKELHDKVEEITNDINQKRTSLVHAEKKNKERELELAKIQEQLHELRFIKENDKHGSRMAGALQALRALHGIRGRLVDLCTIPNDKYRHAVTVALGKNLEAVVVDTTEVAISCVRYLKEQRLPPMTFLPLDTVQGKKVDDRLRTFGGTCKPVVDVIRYDVAIEAAVQYALGQALVCDGMVEAKHVAYGRSDGERFKVVTLDGSVLLRNGVVQGGLASIQSRARKWDEKKYDDLRAARERLIGDVSSIGDEHGVGSEAAIARTRCEVRDLEGRLEFTRGRIHAVEAESTAAEGRVVNAAREVARLQTEIKRIDMRQAQGDDELARCQQELQQTRTAVGAVEKRIFAAFQARVKISNLMELDSNEMRRAKERAEQRQQMLLLIHRLEMSLEAERRRIDGHSVDDLRAVCTRLDKEIKQCEQDLVTYEDIVKSTEKKQMGFKTRLGELKGKLDALEANIRQQGRNSEQELNELAQVRRGVTALQAACDTLRLQRMNIVRRCQMEEISLPLKVAETSGSKRTRPVESDILNTSEPFSLLDETPVVTPGSQQQQQQQQHGRTRASDSGKETQVMVDFSSLLESQRQAASDKTHLTAYKQRTAELLESLQRAIETLAPNLKAVTRFNASEDRLGSCTTQLEEAREKANKAYSEFIKVKELRTQLFMETFEKVADHVDRVYRSLTLSTRAHAVHGSAYLSLEDVEEPYLAGTKYHATPPLKRYMPMELLSGGERTMAALGLLFAIHAVSPTPFFVLDEVDAALDAENVAKLANYVRRNCSTTQFIVISLKDQLYHLADLLVGVLKNKQKESSSVLTMDLRGYPF